MSVMEQTPWISDLSLAVPILTLVTGRYDDQTLELVKRLSEQRISVDMGVPACWRRTMRQYVANGMSFPRKVAARVVPCSDAAGFLALKARLFAETHVHPLNCYSMLFIIDVALNPNDFRSVMDQAYHYVVGGEAVGFVFYRLPENLNEEPSERIHIVYATAKNMEGIVLGICDFANPLANRGIVWSGNRTPPSDPKLLDPTDQLIRSNLFFFASIDLNEAMPRFIECVRAMDSTKTRSECGGVFCESLAMFEAKNPRMVTESKVIDKLAPISDRWPAVNQSNQRLTIMANAVRYYWKSKAMGKVVDAIIRIVADGGIDWIDPCVGVIQKNPDVPDMLTRARELIRFVHRLGRRRKATFIAYLLGGVERSPWRAEMIMEAVNLLCAESESEVAMKQLCAPLLVALDINSLDKGKIREHIFNMLSSVGPQLSVDMQKDLISDLCNLSVGSGTDCNLKLQITGAEFMKVPLEIPEDKSEETVKGPFLYSFFKTASKTDRTHIQVGVGWCVYFVADIVNPLAVDLPVTFAVPDVEQGDHSNVHAELKACGTTRIRVGLIASVVGEIRITDVNCSVYAGVQKLTLPEPLTITVSDNIAKFSARTDLPICHTLRLVDGERRSFVLCVTNTGNAPIETLELKFDKSIEFSASPFGLPLRPSHSLSVCVSLVISRSMSSIDFVVIGATPGATKQAVISFSQPMIVEAGVEISAIETVLPRLVSGGFADELLLAVSVWNHNDVVLGYEASFDQLATSTPNVEGIITDKVRRGFLLAHEATAIIIAVDKKVLGPASEQADKVSVMNAVKYEEERRKRMVTREERPNISRRVGIAAFVEANLHFSWKYGQTRQGRLTKCTALPSHDILTELLIQRPAVAAMFTDAEDGKVKCGVPTELVVTYENVLVAKCSLDLGLNMDPRFGVAWSGSLHQTSAAGATEFRFELYFAHEGSYVFGIEYCTIHAVDGESFVSITTAKQ